MALAKLQQTGLSAADLAQALRKSIAIRIMSDEVINERLSILAVVQEICPEAALGEYLFEFNVAAEARQTMVPRIKKRDKDTGEWDAVEGRLQMRAEYDPLNGLIGEYVQYLGNYRAEPPLPHA